MQKLKNILTIKMKCSKEHIILCHQLKQASLMDRQTKWKDRQRASGETDNREMVPLCQPFYTCDSQTRWGLTVAVLVLVLFFYHLLYWINMFSDNNFPMISHDSVYSISCPIVWGSQCCVWCDTICKLPLYTEHLPSFCLHTELSSVILNTVYPMWKVFRCTF